MIFQVFYYPGYLKRGHNLSVLLQNPMFYNQLKHQRKVGFSLGSTRKQSDQRSRSGRSETYWSGRKISYTSAIALGSPIYNFDRRTFIFFLYQSEDEGLEKKMQIKIFMVSFIRSKPVRNNWMRQISQMTSWM